MGKTGRFFPAQLFRSRQSLNRTESRRRAKPLSVRALCRLNLSAMPFNAVPPITNNVAYRRRPTVRVIRVVFGDRPSCLRLHFENRHRLFYWGPMPALGLLSPYKMDRTACTQPLNFNYFGTNSYNINNSCLNFPPSYYSNTRSDLATCIVRDGRHWCCGC